MKRKYWLVITLFLTLSLTSACFGSGESSGEETPVPTLDITQTLGEENFIGQPNPASFYCQEMGYTLEMVDKDEGTVGICTFPDGSQCEEWDFLAGRCGQKFSYCERQGYQLESGTEIAQCVFPDGSSCSEYKFFTRECQPPSDD